MKEQKFEIQDNSGDKKYFTIIPNYILNHSTANDQALYLQMKRIAGDGGTCEAGYRYFTKQLGIGFKGYQKSLRYLIDHEWITFIGKKEVETKGGIQSVNVYKVNNLWKKNIEFYEGGAESNHHRNKGGVERKCKVVSKVSQGGAESEHKKNREVRTKEEEQICFRLKTWNENQPSPIPGFIPENIVSKYGAVKIESLIDKYGVENNGFSRFLSSLKNNRGAEL